MPDGNLRVTHDSNRSITVRARSDGDEAFVPVVTFSCVPGDRPYLHPVYAPGGGPILTQFRPTDHPWQLGIFTALHEVNGVDYWTEDRDDPTCGTIRLDRVTDVELSPEGSTASWRAISGWYTPDGDRHITETHVWTVRRQAGSYYTIDLQWTLLAVCDVEIGRYDYGGLAVRPVTHESRLHLNNNGETGADTSEKRAAWCDVSSPYDGPRPWTRKEKLSGTWHGITVFDHPQNFSYPSPWRVDYKGLINPSPSLAGDWSIAEGDETTLVYRLIVHRDKADADMLARLHEEFAEEERF